METHIMEYKLYNNDCIKVMGTMDDESVHNVITDPPWNISFLNNKWDTLESNIAYQKWTEKWAKQAYRILKPSGFLLSFGGTRTQGFMTVGIAQAGFEIKDTISHIFSSGMPKSREIGVKGWEGWKTPHLKPAQILVCVAQKPREGTYANNLLKHRTGCFNIAATKIGTDIISTHDYAGGNHCHRPPQKVKPVYSDNVGRFPANVVFDETAGAMLDAQSGIKKGNGHWAKGKTTGYGKFGGGKSEYYGVGRKDHDVGGASRFFFCSKPSQKEKHAGLGNDKNNHPTVQSMKFTQYLIKLVCAPNTILLDPFLGSGTTGCAAADSGIPLRFIGIEINKGYMDIARKRIKHWVDIQPVDIFKDAG
jgi:site-specific DNA-methyltransferase (adenine-specific)